MSEAIEVTPSQPVVPSSLSATSVVWEGTNNNDSKSNNSPLHFSDDEGEADDEHDELDSCNSSLKDSVHDSETSFSSVLDQGNRLASRLKWLMIALLALVTLLAPIGVYSFTHQAQRQQFESDFGATAETIAHACDWNLVRKLIALEDLALEWTSFVASSSASSSWPNVTLPDFDARATRAVTMAGTTSLLFAPHVTRTTRLPWEAYSIEQHSSWMTPLKSTSTVIAEEIYGPDRKAATDSGPFYPVWQHTPMRSDLVNMDLLSLPVIQDELSAMFHSRQAIIGKTSMTAAIDMLASSDEDNSGGIVSNMFFPVFDTLEGGDAKDRNVVGTIVTSISWNDFLSNMLPAISTTTNKPGVEDVVCVLENTCGVAHTYNLRVGKSPEYLGEGDLHNTAHDELEENYRFTSLGDSSFLTTLRQSSLQLSEESCTYSIRIFPSDQAMEQYTYILPIVYASCVGCFFLVLLLVTIGYTRILHRRMVLVRIKAEESRAVVTNLFPSNVRARLFRRNLEQREKRRSHTNRFDSHNSKGSKNSRPKSPGQRSIRLPLPQRKSLKTILRDEQSLSGRRQRTIDNDDFLFDDDLENPNAKPIADSFPGTTILFADIAGFTKWSSEREPEKVFILLQTLFGAFDRIARKRGVFKVETIGDCYVAATGLPDAQSDHALRMTKFARECLFKVPVLLQKLQTTLGPDTLALDMRFGLHSGPVTAGILAGEKSRFQIFGDTVNTAARMESTGQRGKIHVSHPTAELITAGGKDRWLKPREELVEAKGKGLMKTYWVTLVGENKKTKAPRSSSQSTESETGQSSASNSLNLFNNSATSCYSETGCMSDSGNSSGMDFSVDTTSDVVDWTSSSKPPRERSFGSRTSSEQSPSLLRGFTEYSPATVSSSDPSEQYARLIDLLYEVTSSYLKQIAVCRSTKSAGSPVTTSFKNVIVRRKTVLDEVSDFIPMPRVESSGPPKDQSALKLALGRLPGKVEAQLKDFITTLAACHRENNQFHNFERAAHMTISAHKMIGRICKTEPMNVQQGGGRGISLDCTEDIRFDPLLQFAVVFTAMICNVDHAGINNEALCKENPELAAMCAGRSVAEQNAVEIGWELLMDPSYADLQQYMFGTNKSEILRFRQVVVNMVLATDIFNVSMRENRNERWRKAFHSTQDIHNNKTSRNHEDKQKKSFRIAVVLEHVIQAVDMAHMMQAWKVCKKWSNQSFNETYQAYLAGRVDKDPSLDWYNTVLLLFDDYAVPLAIRLRESRIFGMEGDELVRNAVENRRAWSRLGREMVKEMMTHYDLATKHKRSSSKSKAAVHGEGSTTSLVPGDCPASNGASATFSFAGDDDSSKYRFTLDDDLNPRSTQKQRKRSSKKRRPPLS